MNKKRNKQIESLIRFHLSNYFLYNIDKFKELIIITDSELNESGTYMKIWVTYQQFVFKDGSNPCNYRYVIKRIEHYKKNIIRYLVENLSIRKIPDVKFIFDLSGYRSDKINRILNNINFSKKED